MRHSKTEDIFIRMSSCYSTSHHPFIGQLCIAIPTNRNTPYSMLVAGTSHVSVQNLLLSSADRL
jgi:hypothetical protein